MVDIGDAIGPALEQDVHLGSICRIASWGRDTPTWDVLCCNVQN